MSDFFSICEFIYPSASWCNAAVAKYKNCAFELRDIYMAIYHKKIKYEHKMHAPVKNAHAPKKTTRSSSINLVYIEAIPPVILVCRSWRYKQPAL